MTLCAQTLRSQDVITPDEMEAAIGCDACFNDKIALERQKENLKVQVDQRGIMVLNREGKIESLEMLLDRANKMLQMEMNKKVHFKDLPWGERFFIKLGIVIGVAGSFYLGMQL